MSTGSSGNSGDSKVETIARLGQWRIENFGPCSYRRSDSFKLGIWNWYLLVEKNRCMMIRLYPEPSRLSKEQPPMARFVLRVSNIGPPGRRSCVSPVFDKVLRGSDDFSWQVDSMFHGRFIVDVEFLDLKIASINGGEPSPIWPDEPTLKSLSTESSLSCLSRMLSESIHADVIIRTSDGELRAHKAVLSAASPVFSSMFLHNLVEKESSVIEIEDMSLDACAALLGYVYGDIKQDVFWRNSMFLHNLAEEEESVVEIEDMSLDACAALLGYVYGDSKQDAFWRNRVALLAAADKYDILDLKNCCEESLVEDVGLTNVLERLQEAWLYRLSRLKKGCLSYLFEFGKIHDLREEIDAFFHQADRELMVEMFHEILTAWKPM